MYIVICSDTSNIDMSSYKPFTINENVFGPFRYKNDAEEWVDDNCGKSYWSILEIPLEKS